ncbi:MAG: Mur ligase domain-containing protein, partial [Desulfomonilaceae bacterium]
MSHNPIHTRFQTSVASNCVSSSLLEKAGIENINFMNLEQILEVIEPVRVKGPKSGPVSGISIDSRKPIGENYIFWAIKGPHFNGADFALDALKSGARAAVVSRSELLEKTLSERTTIIEVTDTLEALQKLAEFHRLQFNIPVVAISGSNGKTLV